MFTLESIKNYIGNRMEIRLKNDSIYWGKLSGSYGYGFHHGKEPKEIPIDRINLLGWISGEGNSAIVKIEVKDIESIRILEGVAMLVSKEKE